MKKRTLSWLMATVLLSSVCMPVTAAEPQSWEIASMGSESGVSGEGSILQGVNKKNLSYEFTTVDEEKLSSASEGKPKILIFLNARCSNCRYTVGSLAEQTWVEDGSVDVYAVDFYQNSRDSVRAFGEAAGSGKVKLCYGVLSDTMYQYAWHAGYPVGGRISLPLIVLIDSNNKLQYATNGYTTGEYIESQYLAGLFREKEDEGASSDCTGDNCGNSDCTGDNCGNSDCTGDNCGNSDCTGDNCGSSDCTGDNCGSSDCTGDSCGSSDCTGGNCGNSDCTGDNCGSSDCTGDNCGNSDCAGDNCGSSDCTGDNCGSSDCTGDNCGSSDCTGDNCGNSDCTGDNCGSSDCTGDNCGNSDCTGDNCGSSDCTGDNCGGSDCTGDNCGSSDCTGDNCGNSDCTGDNCGSSDCTGDNCGNSDCTGDNCGNSDCTGDNCGNSDCTGGNCGSSDCTGDNCEGDKGKESVVPAFSDVPVEQGNWKSDAVRYVRENGIMNGISGTDRFEPDSKLTRGMFATVLYRMAKNPEMMAENVFSDVADGRYYTQAVLWAYSSKIAMGMGDGSFGVNNDITREQIAKMLCEFGKQQGYDVASAASLEGFSDAEDVSSWATEYMKWAVDTGMISGKPNGDGSYRLDPKGKATRAECAKMLMMFMQKYAS